jgi:aldose sugar dehydrogenase
LEDKIAETRETGEEQIVFGEGFAGVSDLEVGPDDYLYVVSLGQGKIFRIVPGDGDASTPSSSSPTEETISTGAEENEQGGQDPIVEGQEEGQPQEDVDEEEEDSSEEG